MREEYYIGILNEGTGPNVKAEKLIQPRWLWDSHGYLYTVTEPGNKPIYTVVPEMVALEHWAVKVKDGILIRAVEPDSTGDSTFSRNLAKLCPKVPLKDEKGNILRDQNGRIAQYVDDEAYKDWYSNGVKFKLKRMPRTMSAEDFVTTR